MSFANDGAFQFGRRGIGFNRITDGLSNTILIGEKHVPITEFGNPWWDSSLYNGGSLSPLRPADANSPLATSPRDYGWTFGSYHPGMCQFLMADGRVVVLSVTIEGEMLGRLANIGDGQQVPEF